VCYNKNGVGLTPDTHGLLQTAAKLTGEALLFIYSILKIKIEIR
jgi:hypothetical protein